MIKRKQKICTYAVIISIMLGVGLKTYPQIGGSHTYDFLNLTSSARIAALGGDFLAIKDDDITLALTNPSLITAAMHNHLALSFVDYFSDVNYGFASYSRTFKKIGSFNASMQFIDYGKFIRADETGQTLGNFSVNEYAFNAGWGRQLDSLFSMGANFKTIFSYMDGYNSFGIAVDVAGTYFNREKQFAASVIFKNAGRQLKSYTGNAEPLPFEIQLGISKKLAHVPLRFSVLANHLEKFDLTYSDPNNPTQTVDPLTGEIIKEKKFEKSADKVMRHIVFGAELMPSKNFAFRLGYNYQRRKELKVETRTATVGFSWGFGIRISKFHLSFGRNTYHLAGAPNNITITTNLSDFFVKER